MRHCGFNITEETAIEKAERVSLLDFWLSLEG